MRYFRRRRLCEKCGKIVGLTEKAVEFSSRNATFLGGVQPPIIVHQSCWDAGPRMTYEMARVLNEDFSANS
jgi:hypothetical protein